MSLRAMLYEHIILWWIYYFIITLIIVGTIGSLQQLHTFSPVIAENVLILFKLID